MKNKTIDRRYLNSILLSASSVSLLVGGVIGSANATEPCDDFDECKVLIEINATDGDIGFHWLSDADDLLATKLRDPHGRKVWEDKASGPLRDQKKTESFNESAEPVCREELKEDPDDEVVTIRQFRRRWAEGTYKFIGRTDEGERITGETELTYYLPAAPKHIRVHRGGGVVVSWRAGNDLGECADREQVKQLVKEGVLGALPKDVPVLAWEIVVEPDVDDGDARSSLIYSTRVAGNIRPKRVSVPREYLRSLGPDTPVKVEIGAIGGDFEIDEDGLVEGDDDNATFTERGGFCVNVVEGCEDD